MQRKMHEFILIFELIYAFSRESDILLQKDGDEGLGIVAA